MKWRYGGAIITETRHHTYAVCVSLGHRQRARRSFKTLAAAKAYALARNAPCMAAADIADAAQAREILPNDITLLDAARFWLDSHPAASAATLSQLWGAIETALNAGELSLRPRTVAAYRATAARCQRVLGDIPLAHIDTSAISRVLQTAKTPTRRNGLLRDISALLGFGVARKMCASNAAREVSAVKVDRAMPQAFTVAEVREIMSLASAMSETAAAGLALGFFGGLRPAEILRLRPRDIANGYIIISPQVAKTRSARNVPVRANLAQWLARYPLPAAGVSERAIKAVRAAYIQRGGKWYADGARHSYATYAYELEKDAAKVAAELGHSSTDMLFAHYRALARPKSGAEYFAILPKID